MSGKVLVAEDNPSNQKLISILLQKMGVETVIAQNGREAVDKVASDSFALILMDMEMPNLNGFEATRALRNKGCQTPVFALTANAMTDDEHKCIEAGCDGYLAKPCEPRAVVAEVQKFIGK